MHTTIPACLVGLFGVLAACTSTSPDVGPTTSSSYMALKNPQRVSIQGYSSNAMEPFLSRDGQYLFFNNSNVPSVNTNLHYAERVDETTFQYEGEIEHVNTEALEGVPTMDRNSTFNFVSTRSSFDTYSTIYYGRFSNGAVTDVALVPGLSRQQPGYVNFDVEISSDGNTLYFVDGIFSGGSVPEAADIVIARRADGAFQRLAQSAALLEHINTDALEYAVCISTDELELFFTRVEKSGPVIYRAARQHVEKAFGLPQRVEAITGFVEAPTLSPEERSVYYHKKAGDRFVIYRVTR